jgi:hypothetical protein
VGVVVTPQEQITPEVVVVVVAGAFWTLRFRRLVLVDPKITQLLPP